MGEMAGEAGFGWSKPAESRRPDARQLFGRAGSAPFAEPLCEDRGPGTYAASAAATPNRFFAEHEAGAADAASSDPSALMSYNRFYDRPPWKTKRAPRGRPWKTNCAGSRLRPRKRGATCRSAPSRGGQTPAPRRRAAPRLRLG